MAQCLVEGQRKGGPRSRRAQMRGLWPGFAFAAIGLLVACSPVDQYPESSVSWACLKVKTVVDLTSNMKVGEARGLLQAHVDDTAMTGGEREYVRAMLKDLKGVDDGSKLGRQLDDVQCSL